MIPLLRKPLLLHYYLTTTCNCRCGFCDIYRQPASTAKTEDILTNLPQARKLGAKFVDFTGGEPLLFKPLPIILNEALRLGFITSVTTNGLLLAERAEELKGLIKLPRLSLDGSEAVHDKLRGVACYKKALEGLTVAVRNGIRPDIIFTLTPENRDEIDHVYRIALEHGVILILDPTFSYFNNPEHRELDAILKSWRRKKGVYVNSAFLELRKQGGNHCDDPVCQAGDAVIVVSPKNELLLPCFHQPYQALRINSNLKDLWKQSTIRDMRDLAGRLPGCDGCTINCYMDPSFQYSLDRYFFLSLKSKLKYVLDRWRVKTSKPVL